MAVRFYHIISRLSAPVSRGVRGLADGAGSGAGTGGGSGGAIRDAGGAFGKRAVAQEEQYFRKLEREQMEQMRAELQRSGSLPQETRLDTYLERLSSLEEHLQHHQQEAALHRDIILAHQANLLHHQQQIQEHQDAITKLQEKICSLDV